MLTYSRILGSAADADYAEQLHDLEHQGKVDYVMLSSDDIQRRRIKVTTRHGHECGIALSRDQPLFGGAILSLNEDYALIVRCSDVQWLRCLPADTAAALELGYFAGNMHWSVRFAGQVLEIEIKGQRQDYQQRLQFMLDSQRIRIIPAILRTAGPGEAAGQQADHAHEQHSHQHPH